MTCARLQVQFQERIKKQPQAFSVLPPSCKCYTITSIWYWGVQLVVPESVVWAKYSLCFISIFLTTSGSFYESSSLIMVCLLKSCPILSWVVLQILSYKCSFCLRTKIFDKYMFCKFCPSLCILFNYDFGKAEVFNFEVPFPGFLLWFLHFITFLRKLSSPVLYVFF